MYYRYMAPELMCADSERAKVDVVACDMYSFGITMWSTMVRNTQHTITSTTSYAHLQRWYCRYG